MTWFKRFVPAVPLPDGGELETLRDARTYILKLSEADQCSKQWQAAAEALLLVVAASGPEMFARIGMMQALYPKCEPVI